MKKIILLLTLALFGIGVSQANAQVNETYKKELTDFLEYSGSMESFSMTIDQLLTMMGGTLNDEQKEQLMEKAYDSLFDLLVPVYEKEIALDDLKEFNKFYQTPAGKRIAAAQGNIIKGAMQIGQQWAIVLQKLVQETMAK